MASHQAFLMWFKPRVRYFTRGIAVVALAVVGFESLGARFVKEFPELVSHYLHLSLQEAVVIAIFMALLERMIVVQELVELQLKQSREMICYAKREDAYAELCEIIRERASLVNNVDLIQFSGATAVQVLQTLASVCPHASVRVFLFNKDGADGFDNPGFHAKRIDYTLTAVETIREDHPHFNIRVFHYDAAPGMAAILLDNWAISVGWYRIFPNDGAAAKRSIRGHSEAAITALDSAAEPLRAMVQRQVEVLSSHESRLPHAATVTLPVKKDQNERPPNWP